MPIAFGGLLSESAHSTFVTVSHSFGVFRMTEPPVVSDLPFPLTPP